MIDRWTEPGAFESEPFPMRKGELYEIQVEYREIAGAARCRLRWQSKSTPTELSDPVRQQGININHNIWLEYVWADLMKSSRYGAGADRIDAEGWPTSSDVELIISEMLNPASPEMSGTYLLTFKGQAEIHQDCCTNPVFQGGGRTFQYTLPKGAGYDPATNVTTATMALDGSRTMLQIKKMQRRPRSSDDGVTELSLMRPIALGSAQHHRADEIVCRPFKKVVEGHYSVIRWVISDKETSGEWSQRTLPDHPFIMGNGGQPNWEYLVMLAKETGADLYITVPIAASEEYLEKLALLTRYGSHRREPYSEARQNPKCPPLNPNLRIYVECDREIWNWAKLRDPRATAINDEAMKLWDESGSFLTVWGVYTYWPSYDFTGAAGYPITKSYRAASQRLRDEPTFGRPVPITLVVQDTDWSHRAEVGGWRRYIPCLNDVGEEWHSWMLTVPATGNYAIQVKGSGEGRLVIEVDGEPIIEYSSFDQAPAPTRAVQLTQGAHALRVILVGDDLDFDQIEIRAE